MNEVKERTIKAGDYKALNKLYEEMLNVDNFEWAKDIESYPNHKDIIECLETTKTLMAFTRGLKALEEDENIGSLIELVVELTATIGCLLAKFSWLADEQINLIDKVFDSLLKDLEEDEEDE